MYRILSRTGRASSAQVLRDRIPPFSMKKYFPVFQLTWPLGQVSYCHHFSSVICRPSVNISHFNLLLRNHWANCNQTLVEWSLDGTLPKLCPVIPTSNQDGRQAKNRKRGDENKKISSPLKLLSQSQPNFAEMILGCTAELSLTQDPMGNSHKNHLIWNQQLNQNQTSMEQSLDGPLPKLCPTVALSHQDSHYSAVALLLKAALILVSDYRLLGASGYDCNQYLTHLINKHTSFLTYFYSDRRNHHTLG